MIALLLAGGMLLQAPAYACHAADAECWMTAALAQQERAERAESKVQLLEEAVTIGKRLLAEADARGDRWKTVAEKVAPPAPAFYEHPMFWLSVGAVVGMAATVGTVYAVSPAFRSSTR